MVFVTGGTGFLGSHLLFHLLKIGKKVRAIKRADSNFNFLSNVFSFYTEDTQKYLGKIEWVEGDILDIYSLNEALNEVSDVYHAAAIVSFDPSHRKKMMKANVEGTANLINAALGKDIRKFCHVSSIAAIGRAENGKVIDENVVWKTSKKNSNYAISKYGAEREVWRGIEEGLNAVIINPSVILGPRELNRGIGSLISMVRNGFKFYTAGVNGFVDVRDVAESMIRLMESDIYNERFIVSADNLTYKQIFDWIAEYLKMPGPKYKATPNISEIAWRLEYFKGLFTNKKPFITKETARTANNTYYYSSDKLIQALDFKFLPVRQTIRDACELFLKNEDKLKF